MVLDVKRGNPAGWGFLWEIAWNSGFPLREDGSTELA
jgi:hypothetical protein